MRKVVVWSLLLLLVYAYRLPQVFSWDSDWSRDLYDIARLVRGDFQLVGPTLAGGLFAGPYYYWSLTPFLALGKFNENVVLLGHAWLFALGTSVGIGYFERKMKWSSSLVFIVLLGLNPFWIGVARHPWNGITYLPLLLVAYLLFYFKKRWSWSNLLAYGFLWGILLNFHPSVIVVLVPVGLWFLVRLYPRRLIGLFLIGLLITFMPLILFEVKNDLPIIRGLFVYHRFDNFSQASNPGVAMAKVNGFSNVWFMLNEINKQTLNTGWLVLLASTLLTIKRGMGTKSSGKLFGVVIVAIILESLLVRKVFGPHYLYPISLLLILILVILVSKTKSMFIKIFFLGAFLCLTLTNITRLFQVGSQENGLKAEKAVKIVIEKGILSTNNRFAVIGVNSLPIYVPYGHEYRYFFIKYGFMPEKVSEYANADKLLVFSEIGVLKKENIMTWETDQFGRDYMQFPEIIDSGEVVIHVYNKNVD